MAGLAFGFQAVRDLVGRFSPELHLGLWHRLICGWVFSDWKLVYYTKWSSLYSSLQSPQAGVWRGWSQEPPRAGASSPDVVEA